MIEYFKNFTDIEYPQDEEALSDDAVNAVELFLTMDPISRPIGKDVQNMKFFHDIDWKNLQSATPPFIPQPENPTDTGYFEGNFILHKEKNYFKKLYFIY